MVELTEHVIEAYCNDQLSPDEIKEFEVELQTNEGLQKQVRQMMIALGSLKELRSEKLKTRLSNLESAAKVRQMKPQNMWIRWAAAIIILAVAGYFIINNLNQSSPQEIFLAYMEPYPNVIDPGTRDVGTQSMEAFRLYEQGDFKAALTSFDEYLHLNPEDVEIRFYYGVSALLTDEFEIAEKELQIVANSDSRLVNQATWYLALARINTNKADLAKENLNTLIEGQSSYAQRAEDIMKKL